ncbi:hypothetical protein [Microbacterium sp. GCS4]|uniref:hypothetical protein n=1 Tax=Microbacterium sp. GCS4 TaxID=1692239 RepID=UPI000A963469|nr:hypothetical protein [Microbacterium sp. GCS4]
MSSAVMWTPSEIVGAAFSIPLTSFVVAIFVALVLEAWRSRPRGGAGDRSAAPATIDRTGVVGVRHRPELIVVVVIAAAVVCTHLLDFVLRSYVLNMSGSTASLRFALPVIVASVGLAGLAALVVARGSAASVVPVTPSVRRTWLTFSRRRDLVAAALAATVLAATTVAAGLASSTDPQGQHIWLVVPVPNVDAVDPLRLHFYGWTYGVPVLIALAALLMSLAALLRVNAARPFLSPETVAAERLARRSIASTTARVAAASLALALAGAWRLIASTGSVTGLVITGQNDGHPYESAWRYAELAAAAGWAAPVMEIVAYATLLVVVIGMPRRLPLSARTTDRSDAVGARR